MRAHNFIKRFREYYLYHGLFPKGSKVLLGVSGGPDSMALAHLLFKEKIPLVLGHVNYGLRGADSQEDEKLVRDWAKEKGVALEVLSLPPGHPLKKKKRGLQEAARELRYRQLGIWAGQYGCDAVAVAHQQDDWAETFLHQLIRGTALSGWSGMQAKQQLQDWLPVPLVRPLLWAPREQLLEYLKVHQVPWRQDQSNDKVRYTRNKVRHRLVPVIKELNPGFAQTLWQNSERMARLKDYLDYHLDLELIKYVRTEGSKEILEQASLPQELVPVLLEHWLLGKGFAPGVLHQIVGREHRTGSRWSSTKGRLHLSRGVWIFEPQAGSGKTWTQRMEAVTNPEVLEMTDPDKHIREFEWMEHRIRINRGYEVPSFEPPAIRNWKAGMEPRDWLICTQAFAYDRVIWPLKFRMSKPGDRIRPLGMQGQKKLGDLFTDLKLDQTRKRIPVLESGGKVIWVAGICVDESAALAPGDKSALVISFNK